MIGTKLTDSQKGQQSQLDQPILPTRHKLYDYKRKNYVKKTSISKSIQRPHETTILDFIKKIPISYCFFRYSSHYFP